MTDKQQLHVTILDNIIKEIEVLDPYEIVPTLISDLTNLKIEIHRLNNK